MIKADSGKMHRFLFYILIVSYLIKLSRIYMQQDSELFNKELLYNEYQNETDKLIRDTLAEVLCSGNDWTGLLYLIKLLETSNDIAAKAIKEWVEAKESYLVKDDKTGGYKYYALSKMSKETSAEIKSAVEKNEQLLAGQAKVIIEGLIVYYG